MEKSLRWGPLPLAAFRATNYNRHSDLSEDSSWLFSLRIFAQASDNVIPETEATTQSSTAIRLAATTLLAAGIGALEACLRVHLDLSESLARRAMDITLFGAGLYGAAGLAATLLLLAAKRVSGKRAAGSSLAPLVALAALGGLLHIAGDWADAAGKPQRIALFAAVFAISFGVVAFAIRLVPRRFDSARLASRLGILFLLSAGAGVLVAGARAPGRAPLTGPPASARPDILMVVVDTLRADVLSAYGGPAVTPNFDRLAEAGVLFENAIAPASWTLPSVASILSGLYPRFHGVVDFDRGLDPTVASLPNELRGGGYHASAVIGNTFVNAKRGFDRSFDRFDIYNFELEAQLSLCGLVEELLRFAGPLRTVPRSATPMLHYSRDFPWITTRISPNVHDRDLNARILATRWPEDRPRFAYVQYIAPHSPYLPQPYPLAKRWTPFVKSNLARLRELYIGEVEYMDAALGELLVEFDLRDTMIIVTSDHGESFLEHGTWEHGHDLYQEVVRIPLLIAGPGLLQGKRVTTPVSLIDLAPTVLALAGLETSTAFGGENLLPTLQEPGLEPPSRSIFCEAVSKFLEPDEEWFGVVDGPWKIIHRKARSDSQVTLEVYNLIGDSAELDPAAEEAAIVDRLSQALLGYREIPVRGADSEIDPEMLKKMQALGYADSEER